MIRRPPQVTQTATHFPCTTLSRSSIPAAGLNRYARPLSDLCRPGNFRAPHPCLPTRPLPMPASPLLTTDHDAIRVITVNRPDKLNALNAATLAALHAAFDAAAADASVRAVVLAGAGPPTRQRVA